MLDSQGKISTHTPLAERDTIAAEMMDSRHISTHTPLAERDEYHKNCTDEDIISTHTPLAERDLLPFPLFFAPIHFYSHAPRGA